MMVLIIFIDRFSEKKEKKKGGFRYEKNTKHNFQENRSMKMYNIKLIFTRKCSSPAIELSVLYQNEYLLVTFLRLENC